jgi:transposase
MNPPTLYVGLDYHKNFVQVCVLDQQGDIVANDRCENDWQAIVRWTARHGRVGRAALEACNGAADLAEELVLHGGWSVDLAHPGYVHRMKGNPDKTDYSDARMLADLTRVGYLPKVWLAPAAIRELRRLVRYRQQLVDERRSVKLRMRGLLRDHRIREMPGKPWTKAWLGWLEACDDLSVHSRWIMDHHLRRLRQLNDDIRQAEQHVEEATGEDAMIALLMNQPGIGPVTAWMIRAEIGRFDRFNSAKQLSRFCGLSPRNTSSGQRQADAGLIKAGNAQLRATIIEAAWRLIRCDERWNRLAHDMIARGKPKCVVAAAIGNRWMRTLYHQMKPLGLAA